MNDGHEILASFPDRDPDSDAIVWDVALARLRSYADLEDDWDGLGAVAPAAGLPVVAECWLRWLRDRGKRGPSRVVAGLSGTIFAEWQQPECYIEVEFLSPTEAEQFVVVDGVATIHREFSPVVDGKKTDR